MDSCPWRFEAYRPVSGQRMGLGTRRISRGPEGLATSRGSVAMLSRVRSFLKSEDGPTATEYAVMLALIIVVCITVITSLGTKVKTTFTTVDTALT